MIGEDGGDVITAKLRRNSGFVQVKSDCGLNVHESNNGVLASFA
jgi:hypothetical protein